MKLRLSIITLSLAIGALGAIGAPRAEAQLGGLLDGLSDLIGGGDILNVRVIDDQADATLTTAIKTTLSAFTGEKTMDAIEQLLFKEQVLDPAAWGVAKQMQQQLTGELLKWLGGQQPGQNGQVPFIQNYSEYYQGVVDKVVGEYLFTNQAGDVSGQCDPEHSHRVRTTTYNSYVSDRQKGQQGGALQCGRDDDSDYSNALDRLLGDFLTCRDETCAYFAGQRELADRAARALQIERDLAIMGRGMMPQRVCTVVNDPDGRPRQLCEIVNPPSLAADMTSFNMIELPALQMLNMDEFNEIASNLMNNLANQALQGLTGVLGLTGNARYSQNIFGNDGNLSYADALAQDDILHNATGRNNPIKEPLAAAQRYVALLNRIINEIRELENRLDSNRQEFSGCFDLELTRALDRAKEDSAVNLSTATTTVSILTVLDNQYENAATAAARNAVLTTYAEYRSQGFFRTEYQNQQLELTYINLEFAEMVDKFKYDMAVERQRCGGSFDYDGVLTS